MNENINYLTLPMNGYIQKLEEKLNFYQTECNNLQKDIQYLLQENKDLSKKVEEKFSSTFFTQSDYHVCYESEIINNLQSQLSFVIQEKLYAVNLYQTTFKEVDNLEQQLHILQQKIHYMENDKTKDKNDLQEQNGNTVQKKFENLSKKYNESLVKINSLQNQLLDVEKQLDEKSCEEKYKQILDTHQTTITELTAQNEELVKKLEISHLEVNSVIIREAHHKGEILSLKNAFSDVIKETNNKLMDEVTYIKKKYSSKLEAFMEDMRDLKIEIETKNNELSNANNRINNLEKLLEINSGVNNNEIKMVNLQKQLNKSVEKLVLAEQQNAQLSLEYDNLILDLNAMSRNYEENILLMFTDSKKLKYRLHILDNELKTTHERLQNKIIEFEKLLFQLQLAQFEIKKQQDNEQILQDLFLKLRASDETNENIKDNLERNLNAMLEINKRWEQELNNITEKVEKRMKSLKCQINLLQKENIYIKKKLICNS